MFGKNVLCCVCVCVCVPYVNLCVGCGGLCARIVAVAVAA